MTIILPSGAPLQGPQSPGELDLRTYWPLARKWARKYAGSFGFDDALSIALTGLVVARDKWNPKDGPFGAIVASWIRNELNAALRRHQLAQGRAFQHTTLGRAYERAGRLTRFQKQQQSYSLVPTDAPLPGGDGSETYIDRIADDAPTPEEALIERSEAAHLHGRLTQALAKLPERERNIVQARAAGASLKELGDRWSVSRERVRQLEKKALAELRKLLVPPAQRRRFVEPPSSLSVRKMHPAEPRLTPAGTAGRPEARIAATRHDRRSSVPKRRPKAWVKVDGKWEAAAWQ